MPRTAESKRPSTATRAAPGSLRTFSDPSSSSDRDDVWPSLPATLDPKATTTKTSRSSLDRAAEHQWQGEDTPMAKPFKGTINIDIKDSVPDWEPYAQP